MRNGLFREVKIAGIGTMETSLFREVKIAGIGVYWDMAFDASFCTK